MQIGFFVRRIRVGILLAGIGLAAALTAVGQPRPTLGDGLKLLNQKRGTFFLYDHRLLAGRPMPIALDWSLPTESLLRQLLAGTSLTFRRVGDCYLIEPAAAHPSAPAAPVNETGRPPNPLRYPISGYVREKNSGEPLVGATVFVDGRTGTLTNNYGYFALSLPAGEAVDLVASLVGYQRTYCRVVVDQPQQISLELTNNDALDEVVLTADATERAGATPLTGAHTLPPTLLHTLPAPGGERDVLKTLQFLPGVGRGFDGQTGLYVRGGGADQNLLLLDEAPVYNASHLFGFLSVFNVDALKSVRMQKGGFSARYGGRLSSVVEMNLREGNRQRLRGEVGTGAVASRLLLEGPLVRNRASFLLTARRSNFDPLLGRFVANLLEVGNRANWKAGFYDLNAKVNVELSRRDQVYLSGYFGRDAFGGGDSLPDSRRWDNVIRWGNATATLRWNHICNPKLFSNVSLIYSRYAFVSRMQYQTTSPLGANVLNGTWQSFDGLTDYSLRSDWDYFPKPAHQFRAGLALTQRSFRLNGNEVLNPTDQTHWVGVESAQSRELALYADDQWDMGNGLKAVLGGRLTGYRIAGQTYVRAEPRASVSATLNPRTAVRGSYSEMNQFVHQLSNTGLGLPTDLWAPATGRVPPQHARQLVIGLVRDLTSTWQLTVEAYHKWLNHIIGYHPNADFIGLTNAQQSPGGPWERNVTSGTGDASGLEVLLQKRTGRLSGWLAYTWAMTHQRFDELNNGGPFAPLQDRRHSVSWVATYALTPSLRLSASWAFSSGNPQSLPVSGVASYGHLGFGKPNPLTTPSQQLFGTEGPLVQVRPGFGDFRAEAYHRLDLNGRNEWRTGRLTHVLEAGVVNVYARPNPLYYGLHLDAGNQLTLKRVSIFTFLPSLTYALRF